MTRSALPILLLALLVPLAACGKKGPVRPLIKPLPAAPAGFSARQLGSHVLLSWLLPSVNQDGSPLTDLRAVRLYRIEYAPGGYCPECRDPVLPLRQIELDFPEGVHRDGERLLLLDEQVRPGVGYRYRLRGVTRSGFEGDAATVRRDVQPAPPLPTALTARPGDRQVHLHWRLPEGLPAGTELLGFNVYRSQGSEPFPLRPYNVDLVPVPDFSDYGLDNAVNYRYTVRSVVRSGGEILESDAAVEAGATPGLEP